MVNSRKIIGFWLIAVPNLVLFYLSLWLTIKWRYPQGLTHDSLLSHLRIFTVIYLLWLIVFFSLNLFETETFRRYTKLFFSLISAMVVNLILAIGYFYFQPNLILTPRRFLLVDVGISFILIILWDLAVKYFLKNKLVQPVYLFSFDSELANLEKEIRAHDYLGFLVLGHLNESDLDHVKIAPKSIIILPDNLDAKPHIVEKFYNLRNQGVRFYNHGNFYEQLLRRVYLPSLNQVWFIENITYGQKLFFYLVKSFFDYLIGVVLFIVFIVTFPIIALLVKLSSHGPVLFSQDRVGLYGESFRIYKYRTMKMNNDKDKWTDANDARITGIGSFLRKTRLDELPQSINLLDGRMSIVGPRPEQKGIVEQLKKEIPFYDERHSVKPGITGWGQLNLYAKNLEESRLKLEYDLYYIKNRSIFLDLEIILKTVYYIFTGAGK